MLNIDEIKNFIKKSCSLKNFDYLSTNHMRISTIYWASNASSILNDGNIENIENEKVIDNVNQCRNEDGGYGGSSNYPSTLLNTFHALQILKIFGKLEFDKKTYEYLKKLLILESDRLRIVNDEFGEEDTRLICCWVLSMNLLLKNKIIVHTNDTGDTNDNGDTNFEHTKELIVK